MKSTNILLIVFAVLFAAVVVFLVFYKKPEIPDSTVVSPITALTYQNTQYGFNFALPLSWQGYTIVSSTWDGNLVDSQPSQSVTGPEISIRHPLWTTDVPRQDIPIMVFTPDQWNLIQQQKLAVGAAPVAPSMLGQNASYVFALPARYNYAFLPGFEEVQNIIDSKPLTTN